MKQKNDRDKERRLNHLLYSHAVNIYIIEDYVNMVDLAKEYSNYIHNNYVLEIESLRKELNLSHEELIDIWVGIRICKKENRKKYRKNGQKSRKDNSSTINYGNRLSWRNKIRFPRKKRKTAWKRFYKLFPKLENK